MRGNKKHIWSVRILALKTLTLIKDFHSVQFTRNYLSRVNGFSFIITKFPNSMVLYSKQACILSLISLFSGSDFTQDWIQLLAELTVPKMLQCKLKKSFCRWGLAAKLHFQKTLLKKIQSLNIQILKNGRGLCNTFDDLNELLHLLWQHKASSLPAFTKRNMMVDIPLFILCQALVSNPHFLGGWGV